jgi:hypothetical protein
LNGGKNGLKNKWKIIRKIYLVQFGIVKDYEMNVELIDRGCDLK